GKLTAQLLAVRQRLARLTFAQPRPGQEGRRLEQLAELNARELELGKRLRQAGSGAALAPWVALADLRKALPAGSAFIDLARFTVGDLEGPPAKVEKRPDHYAAWVTARTGPVRLIDLGPADKIDEAVKQTRQALRSAPKLIREQGEEEAEKALRRHLD